MNNLLRGGGTKNEDTVVLTKEKQQELEDWAKNTWAKKQNIDLKQTPIMGVNLLKDNSIEIFTLDKKLGAWKTTRIKYRKK